MHPLTDDLSYTVILMAVMIKLISNNHCQTRVLFYGQVDSSPAVCRHPVQDTISKQPIIVKIFNQIISARPLSSVRSAERDCVPFAVSSVI